MTTTGAYQLWRSAPGRDFEFVTGAGTVAAAIARSPAPPPEWDVRIDYGPDAIYYAPADIGDCDRRLTWTWRITGPGAAMAFTELLPPGELAARTWSERDADIFAAVVAAGQPWWAGRGVDNLVAARLRAWFAAGGLTRQRVHTALTDSYREAGVLRLSAGEAAHTARELIRHLAGAGIDVAPWNGGEAPAPAVEAILAVARRVQDIANRCFAPVWPVPVPVPLRAGRFTRAVIGAVVDVVNFGVPAGIAVVVICLAPWWAAVAVMLAVGKLVQLTVPPCPTGNRLARSGTGRRLLVRRDV